MTDKAALDVLDPVNSSWDEAIASVRNSAKWLVIATSAVATFIFGAGTLGARDDLAGVGGSGVFAVALLFGVLGIGFLALVAWSVAQVFRPEVASLHDLTDETAEHLRRNWTISPGSWGEVGPATSEGPAEPGLRLMELIAQHQSDLGAIEIALAEAQGMPGTQGKQTRQALEGAKNATAAKLEAVRETAASVLDMERYHRVKATRSVSVETYAFAGLALICALFYQLALAVAAPADSEAGADGPGGHSSTRVVGRLGPAAGAQGERVWQDSGLASCADGPTVPVVINGGKGTTDDPYLVQTIPELTDDPCPSLSITVTADHFVVTTVPRELEVRAPESTHTPAS